MSSKKINNQVKENLTATLRVISQNEALQVEFADEVANDFSLWNQNLVVGKAVVVPEFKDGLGDENKELNYKFRAACDLAVCYLLFHNSEIHAEKNLQDEEQIFLDEFEKIRVIAGVKNFYFGVVKNILSKIEEDTLRLENSASIILLEEIFASQILPETKNVVQNLAKKLPPKILPEIKKLAQKIANQQEFAKAVLNIFEMLKQQENSFEDEEKTPENQKQKPPEKNDLESFGQENIEAKEQENLVQNGEEEGEKLVDENQKISDLKEDDAKGNTVLKLDKSSAEEERIEFKNAYKIYSSKFDEVIFPQKLIAKKELEILRDQLDLKMNKLEGISKKMSLKLKRKLLSKRNSFLEFDASRGVLDRRKLTRLVVDPLVEDIWVNNKNHEYHDTCLTILLDNSGSMRGNPIVMSAMACEIIAGILEKFSVKTEIIGFTTSDWKGGKARKLWESSGRPKNPGRLNELRHIIYKHFNQKFKKAKINLGLMLKEGLLKENIDGEALLFARSRLMQQSEKRKILLVISDGTPVDDSTNSANDSDILNDHLHHVINKIENSSRRTNQNSRSQIEIVGIGIGHTTEEFYRNSIAIRSLEELGDVMIEKIVDLL